MTNVASEYQNYQRSTLMKQLAAFAHGDDYIGQTSSATYSEVKAQINEMRLLPNKSYILDAGCGNGAFALSMASDLSFRVNGVDLGEALIKEAKKNAHDRNLSHLCEFSCTDFMNLPRHLEGAFDAVLCIGSLYWGQSLERTLETWYRITCSQGELLLFLNLAYGSLTLSEKEAVGATQFVSALSLEEGLARNGWSIIEWSDETAIYIKWLERWCFAMEEMKPLLFSEMGSKGAECLIRRFKMYLTLAKRHTVRRIILRGEHVLP